MDVVVIEVMLETRMTEGAGVTQDTAHCKMSGEKRRCYTLLLAQHAETHWSHASPLLRVPEKQHYSPLDFSSNSIKFQIMRTKVFLIKAPLLG